MNGTIFNIQHYCVHDGPGVRTGVFFKGCPLRCRWCANPESNELRPQLMYDALKCIGCGYCVDACPTGAVLPTSGPVKQDRSRCTGCGLCVTACRTSAREIAGRTVSADEVMKEIRMDALFYGSDGGVTLTGGECLLQPDFALELLRRSKAEGIGTAIETSGYTQFETFERIAPYLDIALYDVKVMDGEKHRQYTGVSNERILENLRRLSAELGIPVIARTPLIPGVNDDEANLRAMGTFLREQVPTLREVDLLPYHRLGEGKWAQLEAAEHREVDTHVPGETELEACRKLLREYGLNVK